MQAVSVDAAHAVDGDLLDEQLLLTSSGSSSTCASGAVAVAFSMAGSVYPGDVCNVLVHTRTWGVS